MVTVIEVNFLSLFIFTLGSLFPTVQESVPLVASCPLAWLPGKSLCVSTAVSFSVMASLLKTLYPGLLSVCVLETGYSRLGEGCLLFCIWDQGLDSVGLQSVILWPRPPRAVPTGIISLVGSPICLDHPFLPAPQTCTASQDARMCGKITSAWFCRLHGLLVPFLAPYPASCKPPHPPSSALR